MLFECYNCPLSELITKNGTRMTQIKRIFTDLFIISRFCVNLFQDGTKQKKAFSDESLFIENLKVI